PTSATTAEIDYTSLDYHLVAYKGKVTFVHDPATGVVQPQGVKQSVEIAHGTTTNSGQLFQTATAVDGTLDLPLLIGTQPAGTLDVTLHHTLASDFAYYWPQSAATIAAPTATPTPTAPPAGFTLDNG